MHLHMKTLFAVCFLMVHLYFKTFPPSSSNSDSSSLSQYRALFCQRCGVGTSHLLLLQGDSHGVQLPGEGIEVILLKTHPPVPLNFRYSHGRAAGPFRAPLKGVEESVVKIQHHESRRRSNISLLLLFECQYQLFPPLLH